MIEIGEILSDVLARPKDAVFYELSRALKAAFPDKAILETTDGSFEILEYAEAGFCEFKEAGGAHTHWTQNWNGRINAPYSEIENGWLSIAWEGHTLLIVWTGILGQHCRDERKYVIADSQEVGQSFFNAVCLWGSEVHGQVLVFREGHWSKSAELFDSIKATSLENLVLPPALKEEVRENVFEFFQAEETYEKYRLPWKRGLLLLGPPGNGKTHMIKGLANELPYPVLYVRSFDAPYSTPHRNIGTAFEKARDLAPCLFVLEDLDALIDDENRSYFLNEMDGFYSNRGILTIATTNHPARLDPAILERPSRFDRKFTFTLPDGVERLRYLTRQNEGLEDALRMSVAGLATVARDATEFSYAYLKELILSSMMAWIREGGNQSMDSVAFQQLQTLRDQMKTAESQEETREAADPMAGMPPAARAMFMRAQKRHRFD